MMLKNKKKLRINLKKFKINNNSHNQHNNFLKNLSARLDYLQMKKCFYTLKMRMLEKKNKNS